MADQTKTGGKDLLAELSGAFDAPAAPAAITPAKAVTTAPVQAPAATAVAIETVKVDLTTLPEEGGGLSYRTARPDEREQMDKIIASIDLQNPEGIIALGQPQRDKLSKLADEVLDGMDPGVKINFIKALKGLVDAVKANSIDEMKKKLEDGVVDNLKHIFRRNKGMTVDEMTEKLQNFGTNITAARKVIREMVDKLEVQKDELVRNYDRINKLGTAFTDAGQEMRIVRAATAEYIRRVATGENTTLTDLAKTAQESGRADDLRTLQTARSSFNVLRNADTEMLTSIGIFDMNVATMAFTKEANIQDRAQTSSALTNSVTRWKSNLAAYSTMMVEKAAQELLNNVDQLDRQSVKNTVELFEKLLDMTVARAATGAVTMRTVMEGENKVAGLLEGVGQKVEQAYAQQEADKKLMEQAMSGFRKRVVNVYAEGPLLSRGPAAPKPQP